MPEDSQNFAELYITGKRFEASGMPASSASEIQAYRDAILAVASELWRDRNGRRRLPNGFEGGLDLRFKEVTEGSSNAQLMLHRNPDIAESVFVEWFDIYSDARDIITSTIENVNAVLDEATAIPAPSTETSPSPHHLLPENFPLAAFSKFKAIGKTLDDDDVAFVGRSRESVEDQASEPTTDKPAVQPLRAPLTDRVREAIRGIDLGVEIKREVSAEGLIIEFDSSKRSFRFRQLDGTIVTCDLVRFQEHLARAVKESLSLDGIDGPDVVVVGDVQAAPGQSYKKITDVTQVRVVRTAGQKRLLSRLIEVEQLQFGWLDADSAPPLSEVVNGAREVIMRLGEPLSGLQLGPVPDGSLAFEWRRGELELTLEIQQSNRMLMVIDNVSTDELNELSIEGDFNRAARFLVGGSL